MSWYIFEMLFDCFISYLYMCVLKLTLEKKKKKFCIFPSVFQLLVWNVRTNMFLRQDALGSIDLLSDSMPSGRVCITFELELFAFSAKHTHTHTHTHTLLFAYSIMLCCVCFLSDWSQDFDILCTSFLIPRYFLWLSLFS